MHSLTCVCVSLWCAGRRVSEKCQQDVAKYKIERSKHINRDVALGESLFT